MGKLEMLDEASLARKELLFTPLGSMRKLDM